MSLEFTLHTDFFSFKTDLKTNINKLNKEYLGQLLQSVIWTKNNKKIVDTIEIVLGTGNAKTLSEQLGMLLRTISNTDTDPKAVSMILNNKNSDKISITDFNDSFTLAAYSNKIEIMQPLFSSHKITFKGLYNALSLMQSESLPKFLKTISDTYLNTIVKSSILEKEFKLSDLLITNAPNRICTKTLEGIKNYTPPLKYVPKEQYILDSMHLINYKMDIDYMMGTKNSMVTVIPEDFPQLQSHTEHNEATGATKESIEYYLH